MSIDTALPTSAVPGALPGGDMPITTPTFAGGMPPTGAGAPPAPADAVKQMTQRILQTLAQSSQRKQFAGAPVPAAVPGMEDPAAARNIGMNTANPHAWGAQRLMAGVATSIQNAVAQKKQRELTKAEADWTYMSSALNELYSAQASGDPRAVAEAQSKVDVVMGDPKKLKQMAKALNQDWLNPEKTTVYGEALKKVTSKTDQTAGQKEQAKQGLMGMFRKLLQGRQQPQLSPEQQQAMAREIQAKAPTITAPGMGIKEQAEAAKALLDLEKAEQATRENYYPPMPDEHGVLRSVNKTNPRDVVTVRDAETGKEIIGQAKGGAAPKVATIQGVPYGVTRGKETVVPDSPNWTKEDQTLFDGAKGAARQKQQLRIDPIIGDQIGAPPDPRDYAKGTGDPEYYKALKKYGNDAEKIRIEMLAAGRIAGAKANNDYKIVEVTDYDENNNPVTHFTTGKAALEAGLSSATQGAKNLSRSKQIEDIEASSTKLRDAVTSLDKPFSPRQIAVMQEALKAGDESIASAEFQALANEQLTDKQFQTALWIKHLNERAMSLRNIAGMGQGAQDTRDAIRSLLPNMGTGSPERMKTMLDAFDNQVKILGSGVPRAGGQTKAEERKKAGESKKASDEIHFTPITQ
jgi:hypothetical protein